MFAATVAWLRSAGRTGITERELNEALWLEETADRRVAVLAGQRRPGLFSLGSGNYKLGKHLFE